MELRAKVWNFEAQLHPPLSRKTMASVEVEEYRMPNGMTIYRHPKSKEWESEDVIWLYNEIFETQVYLGPGGDFFRLDESTKVILDIGANLGLFAIWACLRCPNAQVFAFEPIPHTFDMLTRNIEKHGLTDKIKCFPIALGALPTEEGAPHDRMMEFCFYPEIPNMATCYPQEKQELLEQFYGPELFQRYEAVQCTVRCLGDIIREEGIRDIDYLKVDVEGAELDVVEGMYPDDWLNVKQVAAEVEPMRSKVPKFEQLLEKHGFEFHTTGADPNHAEFPNRGIWGRKKP